MARFFSLIILILTFFPIFGQTDTISYINMNKVNWVDSLDLNFVEEIDDPTNKTIKYFWNSLSIGKVSVTITNSQFNRIFNAKIKLKDSISTPFIINYNTSIFDKPRISSSFEPFYFDPVTGKPNKLNVHTLNITSIIPFGFQIFFEDEYFQSRMFFDNDDEGEDIYIIPIKEDLTQSRKSNIVKGRLSLQFDFANYPNIKSALLVENEVEVIIEYQYLIP